MRNKMFMPSSYITTSNKEQYGIRIEGHQCFYNVIWNYRTPSVMSYYAMISSSLFKKH